MEADGGDWGRVVSEFVSKQLSLLQEERDAEIEQTRALQEGLSPKELQRYGECVMRLEVVGRKTGVGGLLLIKLARTGSPLPTHRFQSGDIVGLVPSNVPISSFVVENIQKGRGGVVYRTTENAITVSFSKMDEEALVLNLEGSMTYNLVRLANDITYKRYRKALEALQLQVNSRASNGTENQHLKRVLFGLSEPRFVGHFRNKFELQPYNPSLNESQKEAIIFAMSAIDLALIHGPPGTGKTTTVVEFILQCVKRGERVLATAPSNIAVDNIAERLAVYAKQAGAKIVRIGHPARLLPSVVGLSLDSRVKQHSHQTELADDVRRDMTKLQTSLAKATSQEKRSIYFQLRQLRKELWEREGKAVQEILAQANIILATNTGAADKKLHDLTTFDVAVIDEAAQAVEASCWIPILKAKKLVLAGDHCQLPPTVISDEAAKAGLAYTLFDRMVKLYGDKVRHMLLIQYRMHHKIMAWSSQEFYEGRLEAHSSVASHLLSDIPYVQKTDSIEITCPVIIVDTSGCGFHEETVGTHSISQRQEGEDQRPKKRPAVLGEGSKANQGEADLVHQYVELLLSQGLRSEDIGVISPYNAQVDRIRHALREAVGSGKRELEKIEVSTVDGFQGREKEVIIISFVRSNKQGEIGFLSESRRMNVAITRAKRSVVVICDEATINHAKNDFLKRMLSYFENEGEYLAGEQFTGSHELHVSTDGDDEMLLEIQQQLRKEREDVNAERKLKEEVERQRRQKEEKQKKEIERRELEESLRRDLLDFLNDPAKPEYTFPSQLDAWARMRVHEIAQEYELIHTSEGKGKERRITVKKLDFSATATALRKAEDAPVQATEHDGKNPGDTCKEGESEEFDEDTRDTKDNKTDVKDKPGPIDPLSELRKIQQQKFMDHQATQKKAAAVSKKQSAAKAKAITNARASQPSSKKDKSSRLEDELKMKRNEEEAELKKLTEEELFRKFDSSKCAHKGCNESTTVLGRVCPHCRLKFCFSHRHDPTDTPNKEKIHGCGDEAKKKAREEWLHSHRPGGTVTGQSSTKPLKPQARSHLESKLQKKMESVAHKGRKPTEKEQKQNTAAKTERGGRGGATRGSSRGGRGGRV